MGVNEGVGEGEAEGDALGEALIRSANRVVPHPAAMPIANAATIVTIVTSSPGRAIPLLANTRWGPLGMCLR